MSIPSWQKGAIESAKRDGLHIVKIEVNGKYAKAGSIAVSAPVGPKMAKKIKKLFGEICDVEKRML